MVGQEEARKTIVRFSAPQNAMLCGIVLRDSGGPNPSFSRSVVLSLRQHTIRKLLSSVSSQLPVRSRRFAERQMFVILVFILFGDSFKYGNLLGLTRYNWIQGHFADIGLPAQFTTVLYYILGHTRLGPIVAFLVPPLAFTLFELTQYPNSDPVDILCYFSGSVAAILSLFIHRRRTLRNTGHARRTTNA